jgi:hypothetical protein
MEAATMSIFQMIAIIFAVFMIYVIRVKSKKYKLANLEIMGWYGIWGGFIVLALFPNLLLGVVTVLNFSRVFDLLVVLAFMILSGLLVYVYFLLKDFQIKLEQMVRKEAIKTTSEASKK